MDELEGKRGGEIIKRKMEKNEEIKFFWKQMENVSKGEKRRNEEKEGEEGGRKKRESGGREGKWGKRGKELGEGYWMRNERNIKLVIVLV